MEKVYRTLDRSRWGSGEWDNEPDKIQWVDEATGLDCLMVRNMMGTWCGYVGVTEGHPHFEKPYQSVDVDVHGGLTYSDFCQENSHEGHGICHVPFEGRPHRVWWLGFDCGHAFDVSPLTSGLFKGTPFEHPLPVEVYRNEQYVRNEVQKLAWQLYHPKG